MFTYDSNAKVWREQIQIMYYHKSILFQVIIYKKSWENLSNYDTSEGISEDDL